MKTPRRLIHCIADCHQCDWRSDNHKTAAREAAKHHRDTGHEVLVEQGITYRLKLDL